MSAVQQTPGPRWCGYCERSIPDCVCPPWMPNTGTELERAQRAVRTGWISQMTPEARAAALALSKTGGSHG